jgi:hypothetical protein
MIEKVATVGPAGGFTSEIVVVKDGREVELISAEG